MNVVRFQWVVVDVIIVQTLLCVVIC